MIRVITIVIGLISTLFFAIAAGTRGWIAYSLGDLSTGLFQYEYDGNVEDIVLREPYAGYYYATRGLIISAALVAFLATLVTLCKAKHAIALFASAGFLGSVGAGVFAHYHKAFERESRTSLDYSFGLAVTASIFAFIGIGFSLRIPKD